ncbi:MULTISPECIES: cohesin domain-containing protein [unclassified Roseateles]|uniref:cohesin domain-containing protein n=1 Tax=unclassified Roseateles TaxID=2626991 RepID=UPI0006F4F5A1|nr:MULTISPECIES: cohesin domain-containing protein [unclassified Roseateles]KQW51092.1 hypothetical protein ASC81_00035 [Pelomonas sp. Root405]KRA77324.1 hypothetical protein ASD88_00035 [Pelomonas sp. Root662]
MRLISLRRAVVCAVLGWVGAVSAATVNLSSSASHVTVGSSVTLSFAVAGLHQGGIGSLAGFDLDLRYDNSLLQFQSFGFIDAGSASNMLDLPEPAGLGFIGDATAASGVVDAFGLSGNSTAVLDAQQADAFDFLTLTFIALQASSGTDFVVDLADPLLQFVDGTGLPINLSFISARAALVIDPQGGGGNTVPEPAALALALVALLGAVWARWQSMRAGRAALAVSLALAAPLASHAQTQAAAKAAEPTPIDVRVIEVAGTRAKVRADDGREYWVTVGPALTADKVGQRLRGQALPRGDAIKVNAPTFSAN